MDYVSEVNSHVAKLLLLWEPLVLKSLTSVYKIRARSVCPHWLLPVTQELMCCHFLGRVAAFPISPEIFGQA